MHVREDCRIRKAIYTTSTNLSTTRNNSGTARASYYRTRGSLGYVLRWGTLLVVSRGSGRAMSRLSKFVNLPSTLLSALIRTIGIVRLYQAQYIRLHPVRSHPRFLLPPSARNSSIIEFDLPRLAVNRIESHQSTSEGSERFGNE